MNPFSIQDNGYYSNIGHYIAYKAFVKKTKQTCLFMELLTRRFLVLNFSTTLSPAVFQKVKSGLNICAAHFSDFCFCKTLTV